MPRKPSLARETNAHSEARSITYRLAIDAGAYIVERPILVDPAVTVRDVDEAAGVQAARELELAARGVAVSHIHRARRAGLTWHDIGVLLYLEPDPDGRSAAEAAFDYTTAGDPGRSHAGIYTWPCRECGHDILDRGLIGGPAEDEEGHTPECKGHARAIANWEARSQAERGTRPEARRETRPEARPEAGREAGQ
jgi:hypothetical protein